MPARRRDRIPARGRGEANVYLEQAHFPPDGSARHGRGSRAARDAVRRRIPPLAGDRYLKTDLDAALALAEDGSVLAATEAAVGALD